MVEEIFDAALLKISEKAEKAKAGAAFIQLMRHATLATSVKAGNRTGRPCSGPGSQDKLQLRHTESVSAQPLRNGSAARKGERKAGRMTELEAKAKKKRTRHTEDYAGSLVPQKRKEATLVPAVAAAAAAEQRADGVKRREGELYAEPPRHSPKEQSLHGSPPRGDVAQGTARLPQAPSTQYVVAGLCARRGSANSPAGTAYGGPSGGVGGWVRWFLRSGGP